MSNKLQPIAQSFLVCREIFTDEVSRTRLLMHPFCRLNLPGFPATFPVCLFIQLTGGHGTYRLGIQLHDAEGAVLADVSAPAAEALTDPLEYAQATWRDLRLRFPKPGRYSLVLLADREEIGRHMMELALTVSK